MIFNESHQLPTSLDDLLDLLDGQRMRLLGLSVGVGRRVHVASGLDGGRRNGQLAVVKGGVALATLVPQLQNELGAVGMHALDDGLCTLID